MSCVAGTSQDGMPYVAGTSQDGNLHVAGTRYRGMSAFGTCYRGAFVAGI